MINVKKMIKHFLSVRAYEEQMFHRVQFKCYVDAYSKFCLFDSASSSIVLFCCHLTTNSDSLTVNQLSFNVEGVLQETISGRSRVHGPLMGLFHSI